ncbi:MAG: hypothetical protein K6U00_15400, partial [Armatimonadetes bacterium]|nr:hypothetical protein [Armatimonadota bacterium]
AQLSICNFIGSKVNHNSLLLAVISFVAVAHGTWKVHGLMSGMFVLMTLFTVIVSAMLVRGRIYRWHGAFLVAGYILAMVLAVR